MPTATKPVIEQYLNRYAEVEAGLLTAGDTNWPGECQFAHALIIPAYREPSEFFARLVRQHLRRESVLLIAVINQPDSLDTPDTANDRLLQTLQNNSRGIWQKENLWLGKLVDSNSAVLIVDRFSKRPIPRRQGVGLARKIGTDLALALYHRAIIKSPWLYASDADTLLPNRYFSTLDEHSPWAAAVYPYRHECSDDALSQATLLYEQRLKQYVDGLALAGSPYAYHTLGSTIAVQAEAYAKVRGFPKRNGGEDFHLLNKLAKVGRIISLEAPPIQIQIRDSDRVPFGTGPAVSQLLKEADPQQARIFYHPRVFAELKDWLDALPSSQTTDLSEMPLSRRSITALRNLGTETAVTRARRTSNHPDTYARHLSNWFDALKTLRFIHNLQEQGLGNITFAQLKAHGLSARTPNPPVEG